MTEKGEKQPELLSITGVARFLVVSAITLRRWNIKGILNSFRDRAVSGGIGGGGRGVFGK